MNLFINFYASTNPDRQKELDLCLENNKANKYIKKIYIINRDKRVSFGQMFDAMSEYPDDVNIVCNTDIYFDETISLAKRIKSNQVFALTRWEHHNGRIMMFHERHGRRVPMEWSQDAWIFRGAPDPKDFYMVEAVKPSMNARIRSEFLLGIPGCDNKLAAMLKTSGYDVINPCYSIRAIHVHKEDSRSYPDLMILQGIKPQGLVYAQHL